MHAQPDAAQQLADQLNAYTGDNAWQDIIEASDYDRAATGASDPWLRSDIVVMPGGKVVAYAEPEQAWRVYDSAPG